MKKILGISLVALMSVTAANAEIASKAYVDAGIDSLDATVSKAAGADGLELQVVETNGKLTSVSGSIAANTYDRYGAATDVQTAVMNKIGEGYAENQTVKQYIDAKASGDAGAAVAALDAGVSQTASAENGQLTLSVTQEDGVITAVSGSITPNTYDAYGAASTAETNAKAYADGLASNYDAAGAATTAAAGVKTTVDAYTVNSKAISTNPTLAGGDIALTSYAKGTDKSAVAATDTVNSAIGKLENQIADATAGTTSAINALNATETAATGQVVTGVTQVNGVITSVTSADPLTNANYALQAANQGAGKYVLTAVYDGDALTGYSWELIDRTYGD